ncbi:MAG: class I SAM-dependent methyltransferase, partial [bacterium]|nr:class I SAM-dependent methyltransferase [bacterium]
KRIYKQRHIFFNKIINREITKKGKITLLDYGCGDGYWTSIFSQSPLCEVVGVDYNKLRLERCKINAPKAKFIEADLRKKNPGIKKFDIVFCSQVIEHIEDDTSFLENIRNYIKENGVFILGTTNEGCFTQKFRNYITKEKTDHIHFYTEKEIREKIKKAGFIIKNIHREVFYPGFDKLYYRLTGTDLGFKILETLTILLPSQCSDYYFECSVR